MSSNDTDRLIDLITPSGVKSEINHIWVDEGIVKLFFVASLPSAMYPGPLKGLVNYRGNFDTAIHIERIDSLKALKKLERKITELESTRRSLVEANKLVGAEVTIPLESAERLRDSIISGSEALFRLSITIATHGDSVNAASISADSIKSLLAEQLYITKDASFMQTEGLRNILPLNREHLGKYRAMDSSSLSMTFPFASSILMHKSGVVMGLNKVNNSLVILDRFELRNANSVTFAQSGAGKSYFMKVEILRQLSLGNRVIIIDPEGEYERICDNYGGEFIDLGREHGASINPMEFIYYGETVTTEIERIDTVCSIVSLMIGGVNDSERQEIEDALVSLLNDTREEGELILSDLYVELVRKHTNKGLCRKLNKYVYGSMSKLFNTKTRRIGLDSSLTVFGIKHVPEIYRPLYSLIISNYVKQAVAEAKVKTLLVIDEGWMLLEFEESARFISGLVRMARKYYLGVAVISQQANDFLNSKHGKIIASQSALQIILRQDSTTINEVVNSFGLSEYEKSYLLSGGRGDALIIADNQHCTLKVTASKKEHSLITTDPSETKPSKDHS